MSETRVSHGGRPRRRVVRAAVRFLPALVVAALLAPAPAAARLALVRGHVALGFSHVMIEDAPGGSLSSAAGVDYPISSRLRVGGEVGYHLLGSRTLVQGSLSSNLDYSLLEALALVHWTPFDRGPELRVSAGSGLCTARADLGASSIGAAFADETIGESHAGFAASVTVLPRRESPVRLGFELGGRYVPVEREPWKMAFARVAIHY